MCTIKDLVEEFKNKTMQIFNCLNDEKYEKLDTLFDERQKIIDLFSGKSDLYEPSKIAEEIRKTDIVEMDEKINKLIKEKMLKVRNKIVDIDNGKTLRKSYGRKFSSEAVFLNKKIY